MRFFNKLLTNMPFFTYSKKVDPILRGLLSNERLKYIPLIILFDRKPDTALESRVKRLGFKKKYTLTFINGITGMLPVKSFDRLVSMLEVEKLYFDGKASLMGTPLLQVSKQQDFSDMVKPIALSGRDVVAAFIDSGIYPHQDFHRPRNRILAFKDFVNENEYPYDDNGHGTACIGAGFGAAVDGRFRALAYDAGIICAKAFDRFGNGSFSDILGAMQWITDMKEKHNIRVAVLPFGAVSVSPKFNILNVAVTKMWNNNIFVCTCTGNLGPAEGSMTSPGSCISSFTSAACKSIEAGCKQADFSGCGPIAGKADKPDVIMPGVNIETLNADTGFLPRNKTYFSGISPQVPLYTQYSGTSIAASLTGAAAVLLFQRKPELTPEDAKNVLKKCAVSINERKIAQGVGMIDVRKLENI